MVSLFARYRSLSFLLFLLLVQLVLVAFQVKTDRDVRLIRVWAVGAVTPPARLLSLVSRQTSLLVEDYVGSVGARRENRRLVAELDRLKIENHFLRSELRSADRGQALSQFKARTPSRTIAARVIGSGPGPNARVVFLDRGSSAGVRAGMAVINADGVVGKVTAAYPTASQVLLVTDPNFAAGVISGKNRVQGTLKGLGRTLCTVDYLENEEKVEVGEWFYTTGDDRVFPRGLPVGQVRAIGVGRTFKEVLLAPSGLQRGLEEVLVVLEGVHQNLPEVQNAGDKPLMLPAPPAEQPQPAAAAQPVMSAAPAVGTDADRLLERYRKAAEAQKRPYGDNPSAQKPPPAAPAKP